MSEEDKIELMLIAGVLNDLAEMPRLAISPDVIKSLQVRIEKIINNECEPRRSTKKF